MPWSYSGSSRERQLLFLSLGSRSRRHCWSAAQGCGGAGSELVPGRREVGAPGPGVRGHHHSLFNLLTGVALPGEVVGGREPPESVANPVYVIWRDRPGPARICRIAEVPVLRCEYFFPINLVKTKTLFEERPLFQKRFMEKLGVLAQEAASCGSEVGLFGVCFLAASFYGRRPPARCNAIPCSRAASSTRARPHRPSARGPSPPTRTRQRCSARGTPVNPGEPPSADARALICLLKYMMFEI
ncbi:hypothetical protein SEVIR_8G054800v4 [Setaria viridis]|uniref:Uncharacterized protein n=1 Tax=Setaria viridis TaxID=4556 RepID=A0A4U6TQ06_SETVI|nr:uncharacterized protein LOC117866165 [Setaria viridis]TKV99606.1 hypothetical protein SEVIR_8G054800v2 [Setaria viridis]